ncbi:AraC family transcriptional regulator [Thalassospira alkalitolerans]|uniref:AraC family transcriptional regulator n=1 Tax=Thalassospira alkalitolerans TaxID=1293890 RepID=A0A1Y2LF32_9PROT|nr:AraC family transcriptional regulator [Thalassospira alkalitolerans]
MLEPFKVIIILISVVGLVQGIFLIALLRHEGKRAFRANRWLIIFTLTICMGFADDILDVLFPHAVTLYFSPIFVPSIFTFVPSIYLYFREIFGRPPRNPFWYFAIIIPVMFCMMAVSWYRYTQLSSGNIQLLDVDLYDIYWDLQAPHWLVVLLTTTILAFCVQFVIYMVKIWQVAIGYLRQAGLQLVADEAVLRRWVLELLVELSLIFTIYTVTNLFDIFVARSDWLLVFVQAGFVLIFFRMCHIIAANPALFVQPDWDDLSERDEAHGEQEALVAEKETVKQPDLPRVLVGPNEIARICTRLDRIVAQGDMLFDPLLAMPKLAAAVGATPNQLSHVLNQHLGKSFFDFVNAVRIDAASRQLIEDPDRTILDIATGVGFNSKSTFNLAFKKITGKTPTAFRDENLFKSQNS